MAFVFFAYGLAFFSLGLVLAFYPRRGSGFRFASDLWLVAAFGILHGLNEWVDMFLYIEEPGDTYLLRLVRPLLMGTSFFCLAVFGIKGFMKHEKITAFHKAIPVALFIAWAAISALSDNWFSTSDIWGRYLLGVPGIFLTFYGLLAQAKDFSGIGRATAASYLRVAAISFAAYGVLSGLITPKAAFFPASVLNYDAFYNLTALPVQFFRMITAVIIAYSFIHVMQVFNWESKVRLEEARNGLEIKVKHRTSELVEANEELEKEIAGREDMEKLLRESEEKYRSLVESTEDTIFLLNRDLKYLFTNNRHLARLDLTDSAQILGTSYLDYHPRESSQNFIEKVAMVFETGRSVQHEHQSHRDGKYFLRTISPVRNRRGDIVAVTVISKEVSEQKRMEEELRTLSLTDELTGLYNRRGFLALAEQEMKMANRLGSKIIFVYADLDDLKEINDRFGHRQGDIMIIEMANVLRETFRDSDIIARIGGDEFVITALESSGESADNISSRLMSTFGERFKQKGGLSVSVSVGTAFYDPVNPKSIESLLAEADSAMYEHKRSK